MVSLQKKIEITQPEEQKDNRMKKRVNILRDLYDTIEYTNTHRMSIPEDERNKGVEVYLKK